MQSDFQTWLTSSYLSGGNASYIEDLYEAYLKNPESVEIEWQNFFKSLPQISGGAAEVSHAQIRDHFLNLVKQPQPQIAFSTDVILEKKQANVERLIDSYRTFGHLAAKLDPLGSSRPQVPELELSYHDLSSADFNLQFRAPGLMGKPTSSLKEIVDTLQNIYCNTIGFEYMYIRNQEEVRWLRERIERTRPNFSNEEKKYILQELIAADGLEKYLGTKYVGQKRFSLEGGDTLIPMLQKMLFHSNSLGVKSIVLCMAHRGRLNVLVNVAGQSPEELFQEFEGKKAYGMTSGDVKYHLGFSSDIKTSHGSVHMSVAFNPSHLEIISPVAMGSVRARQDRHKDAQREQVMSIMIHGDASFAGQGVIQETLNMSQVRAFYVAGSLHVIINNQIGFTTDAWDARTSLYCSDIGKMIDAPVLHVNGDDPEAAVYIAQLATDYRMTFHKDVVVDLVCYRRLGHNEADEPAATQPLMYHVIKAHPVPREVYAQKLISEKVCAPEEIEEMMNEYRTLLDQGRRIVTTISNALTQERAANWTAYLGTDWNMAVDTAVSWDKLNKIIKELEKLPEGFELQRQVGLMIAARNKMFGGELPLDFGAAETLAYATLLTEGYPIRIDGQDSRRGTFAHRHAVLHDQNTGEEYIPLQHLTKSQAKFEVYDSVLSEEGVLAFEYGYAATDPKTFVMWEAQYGDFANGAQVVVDQFISSGEQKWNRLCGLAMFLPHGYEGGGPEHSSARLERYLQLCAQNNMQVCVPSTPAQIFHMFRRQMIRPYRKPLIIMSPKSILRNKLAVSSLEELVTGKFQLVIKEIEDINPAKTRRVVLCSGKIYYDLLAKRQENKQTDVALIRIEQLYPFPYDELKTILEPYKKTKEIIWCQEEPQNQGAWYVIQHAIARCMVKEQVLDYVGRPASAAPAVGYSKLHMKQQAEIVDKALG